MFARCSFPFLGLPSGFALRLRVSCRRWDAPLAPRPACAPRRAVSRLRSPAAKNSPPDCFITRLRVPCRRWDAPLALRPACAPRRAVSRLRSPAARNSPPDCFLRGFESPAEGGTLRLLLGLLALRAAQSLGCAPRPLKTVHRTVLLRGFESLINQIQGPP